MKFVILIISITCTLNSCNCKKLNTAEIIKEKGYCVEEYTVQTEDGYLLKLYRIPKGINSTNSEHHNKKVVLLVHGLTFNAGCFVISNPKRALGYILADNDYDVWLLNVRGTANSNKHIRIDPKTNPKEFFNFSWHEIGIYDIPVTIDFILNKTNQNQLQYVGYSQGSTSFFVMASMKPEYNSKIRLASMLAPPVIMRRVNLIIKLISLFNKPINAITNLLNIYNLVGINVIRGGLELVCVHKVLNPVCMIYYDLFLWSNETVHVDQTDLSSLYRVVPSDASLKQIIHYLQIISTGKFRQFDYGSEENLIAYGSETAPDYNLESVTSPIALYVGRKDVFSTPEDVKLVRSILKNVTKFEIVKSKYFNHFDFIWAVDVVNLLYKSLVNHMALY